MRFLINGGILGVLAVLLQKLLFMAVGGQSSQAYFLASALTYVPLLLLNFRVQRSWIFARNGIFWRFTVVNLSIMLLVSLLSPVCRYLIDNLVHHGWGDNGGFLVAALLGSAPSYLLTKRFVFDHGSSRITSG